MSNDIQMDKFVLCSDEINKWWYIERTTSNDYFALAKCFEGLVTFQGVENMQRFDIVWPTVDGGFAHPYCYSVKTSETWENTKYDVYWVDIKNSSCKNNKDRFKIYLNPISEEQTSLGILMKYSELDGFQPFEQIRLIYNRKSGLNRYSPVPLLTQKDISTLMTCDKTMDDRKNDLLKELENIRKQVNLLEQQIKSSQW